MTVESIASLSCPVQASQLRIGSFCLISQYPCKIVDISSSGTGKHGKCKYHFVGMDIFTGKRHEHSISSVKNVESPNVNISEYDIIDIDDEEYLSLMDKDGSMRYDLKLPSSKELKEKIVIAFNGRTDTSSINVTVISSMGHEAVISFKQFDGL